MEEIYKFKNRTTIDKYNGYITINEMVYTNGDAYQKALETGYKILEIDEYIPSFNRETEYLTFYYEEKENKIIQHCEVNKIDFKGE